MHLNNNVTNFLVNFLKGLILVLVLSPVAHSGEVIGWVENVGISGTSTIVKAKIDTGADSSSLHCDCMKTYERDGDLWVTFSITDIAGKSISYDKKIIRKIKVKRHFGEAQQRYVVRMGLCIGDQYGEVDVNLVDRSGFNYDLLVGRKYLKDRFTVDPAKKFTAQPSCDIDG